MPGNKPKSQHYVQLAYLEAFCDPVPHERTGAPFLWIHAANQRVRRQIPKECAVENYFYCHEAEGQRSFLGEEFLADLETASDDVLKAAQRGSLPTSLRDRFTLAGYVAMSLVRTPASKRLIDQSAVDLSVQQIRDLISDPIRHAEYCAEMERETGEKVDPEESKRKLRGGKVRAVQTSRGWSLRQMAELMMQFQEMFMRMRLLVLHASDGLFLTSDCPVRVHDPSTAPLLPPNFLAFEMLFPLSRGYCLAGTYSAGPTRLELGADQVRNINRLLVRQADRCVYAPFDAEYIQAELRNSFGRRELTQPSDVIQF